MGLGGLGLGGWGLGGLGSSAGGLGMGSGAPSLMLMSAGRQAGVQAGRPLQKGSWQPLLLKVSTLLRGDDGRVPVPPAPPALLLPTGAAAGTLNSSTPACTASELFGVGSALYVAVLHVVSTHVIRKARDPAGQKVGSACCGSSSGCCSAAWLLPTHLNTSTQLPRTHAPAPCPRTTTTTAAAAAATNYHLPCLQLLSVVHHHCRMEEGSQAAHQGARRVGRER